MLALQFKKNIKHNYENILFINKLNSWIKDKLE